MHMVNAHMNGPRKKCGVCPHNTAGNMGAVGGRRNIQSSDSRKDPVEQQQKFIAVIAEDKLPNVPARLRYAFANKKTDGADYLAGIPPPSPLLQSNEKANKII